MTCGALQNHVPAHLLISYGPTNPTDVLAARTCWHSGAEPRPGAHPRLRSHGPSAGNALRLHLYHWKFFLQNQPKWPSSGKEAPLDRWSEPRLPRVYPQRLTCAAVGEKLSQRYQGPGLSIPQAGPLRCPALGAGPPCIRVRNMTVSCPPRLPSISCTPTLPWCEVPPP